MGPGIEFSQHSHPTVLPLLMTVTMLALPQSSCGFGCGNALIRSDTDTDTHTHTQSQTRTQWKFQGVEFHFTGFMDQRAFKGPLEVQLNHASSGKSDF